MTINFKELWDQAGANVDRLHDCKRHRFDETDVQPFQQMTCLECGGVMILRNVGDYVRGYIAAGGNPEDIWPAWRKKP